MIAKEKWLGVKACVDVEDLLRDCEDKLKKAQCEQELGSVITAATWNKMKYPEPEKGPSYYELESEGEDWTFNTETLLERITGHFCNILAVH